MMIFQDIHSLTDFKSQILECVSRLNETGNPTVLTFNASAKLVVQDAASYKRLLEIADRLETIPAVRQGVPSTRTPG
jgi:hypothetical protein